MPIVEFGIAKLFFSFMAFVLVVTLLLFSKYGKKRLVEALHYIIALVSLASALSYLSLPPLVPWEYRPVNTHDSLHYYIGAKYFDELGYFQLYNCLLTADTEDSPPLSQSMAWRMARNLQNNQLKPAKELLASSDNLCRNNFSQERWFAFKQDATFFRQLLSQSAWEKVTRDHGFNATPVWILVGSLLTNSIPLSESSLLSLTRIDLIILAASLCMIAWAFGWRTASVAMLVMTTNPLADPFWTLGSLSRWDWLFFLTSSVCLMKKSFPFLSGASAVYAVGLRIFPLALLAPLGIQIVKRLRSPRISSQTLNLWLMGFTSMALLLLALSIGKWGIGLIPEFGRNIWKHQDTISKNDTGTKPLVEFSLTTLTGPAELPAISRFTPEARTQIRPTAKGIQATLLVIFLIILVRQARNLAPWQLLASGTLLIPFIFTALSNYYYMFLLVTGLLAHNNLRLLLALLATNLSMRLVQFYLGEDMISFVIYSLVICVSFVPILLLIKPESTAK